MMLFFFYCVPRPRGPAFYEIILFLGLEICLRLPSDSGSPRKVLDYQTVYENRNDHEWTIPEKVIGELRRILNKTLNNSYWNRLGLRSLY